MLTQMPSRLTNASVECKTTIVRPFAKTMNGKFLLSENGNLITAKEQQTIKTVYKKKSDDKIFVHFVCVVNKSIRSDNLYSDINSIIYIFLQ